MEIKEIPVTYSIEWMLIIRIYCETSSVLITETKYDIIKKFESGVSGTELAKYKNWKSHNHRH